MDNFRSTSYSFTTMNQGNEDIIASQIAKEPPVKQIGTLSPPLKGQLALRRRFPLTTTTHFNRSVRASPFSVMAKQGKENVVPQSTNVLHTGQIGALSSPVRGKLTLGRLQPAMATSMQQTSQTEFYEVRKTQYRPVLPAPSVPGEYLLPESGPNYFATGIFLNFLWLY